MKRLFALVATAAVVGLILGGLALFHSDSTKAAGPFTIAMSSYPGETPSGVTGSTTIMDIAAGPVSGGFAIASGITAFANDAISPAGSDVITTYFTGKNCDPTTVVAILIKDPGQATQQGFLVDGVQLGALDGTTIVIKTDQTGPYGGGAASIQSAGLNALYGYNDTMTPAYRLTDVQYLACGNVDQTAVVSPFGGHLGADWRLPPVPGDINGDRVVDTGDVHLEIDMVQDGVSADGKPVWCAPVDAAATHSVVSTYQVAVCLTSSPIAPTGFNFNFVYNDALNLCVDTPCGADANCLDSNPDANAGAATIFGNANATNAISLGAQWNCGVQGVVPVCDQNTGAKGAGLGQAYIQCVTTPPNGTQTLPVGVGVSAPIAVLTFQTLAVGVDTLALDQVSVIKVGGSEILACPGDVQRCLTADDTKAEPTAGPTATPIPPTATPLPPTPTNTPVPGVRMEKDPAYANLWLMKAGCVVPEEGKGCLVINLRIFGIADTDSPNDSDNLPEGLGAWEDQKRFDHKFISLTPVPDNTWLESNGRVASCWFIVSENNILEGCTTKDTVAPPATGHTGPEGDGLVERIYVIPNLNDLIYRSDFRPTKDNGIVTDIVDDNCEVTDTLGEQIPGTLPGQLTTVCGDAHITIRMLQGDMDLDCDVDVLDDQAMAFRYGSQLGLMLYDRWFDLEPKFSDDDIDIKDLQFVFGRNWSTCQAPIPDDQACPVGTAGVNCTPLWPDP